MSISALRSGAEVGRSSQAAGKLQMVRAADLAGKLGVDPKPLRQWLRDNFNHARNTPWISRRSRNFRRARDSLTGVTPELGVASPRPTVRRLLVVAVDAMKHTSSISATSSSDGGLFASTSSHAL